MLGWHSERSRLIDVGVGVAWHGHRHRHGRPKRVAIPLHPQQEARMRFVFSKTNSLYFVSVFASYETHTQLFAFLSHLLVLGTGANLLLLHVP